MALLSEVCYCTAPSLYKLEHDSNMVFVMHMTVPCNHLIPPEQPEHAMCSYGNVNACGGGLPCRAATAALRSEDAQVHLPPGTHPSSQALRLSCAAARRHFN